MNSKQIECALELALTLNFGQAAENLYITQPTLSYHIKTLEDEIGFQLFERSGKGAVLTPAGKQFTQDLRQIQNHLQEAIERGQNFGYRYNETIRLAIFDIKALPILPQAIKIFSHTHPNTYIDVQFNATNALEQLLNRQLDIALAITSSLPNITELEATFLYQSPIYLVVENSHPLSTLKTAKSTDLNNQTLMVSQISPKELKEAQKKVISKSQVKTFNSPNHSSTITNILSGRGVCLVPGFLKDNTPNLTWIPFEETSGIACSIVKRKDNHREVVQDFQKLLNELLQDN